MTPSVALFNKLGWIPFYEQHKIDKCTIMYKRINGTLPNYLNEQEDALSLFRQQDCGTVHQLKLGN